MRKKDSTSLREMAPQMLSEGFQIVLLGSGRRRLHQTFEKLREQIPEPTQPE